MRLAFNIQDQFFKNNASAIAKYQSGNVFDIVFVIIRNIYVLTGIVLFFFIVIGGLGMILNAGDVEKQKQGSKTVTSAIFGYLIMFTAYWLIKIVQLIFGVKIINF